MAPKTPRAPGNFVASFPGQKSTGAPLPNPPLNLAVTGVALTSVSLSWNAPLGGSTTYNLYRNGVKVQTGIASTTTTDTGLTSGTGYTYYVTSQNTTGEGSRSNQVVGTTGSLPNAPQSLGVTGTSSSSVSLSWSAPVGGATSYNLYRNSVQVQTGISGTSTTDTGLASSTTYSYFVTAVNAFGEGQHSNTVNGTTQSSTGTTLFIPAHIARTGSGNYSGMAGQLATVLSFIKKALDADINNQFKAVCVVAVWAQLEGPTAGVYDGSWGGSQSANLGFAGIQQVINLLKTYTFKRFLMISLNQTGNGAGANTSTSFPSSFAPAYLNSPTYAGGCEWGGRSGYSGYPNVNTTFYNTNTAIRVAAMVKAYNTHFGPFNPSTGDGIGMWELTNEMSLQTTSMLTNAGLVDAINNGYATIRQGSDAAPVALTMRPTFVHPETPSGYNAIDAAMLAAKIMMGNEDGSNNFLGTNGKSSWGDRAYAGRNPGTGVVDPTMTNYTQNTIWAHAFNVENAELGKERSPTAAVPNADVGSGFIYDVATDSGIMGGANYLQSSFIIWFLDGQQGPNVNRFQFPLTNGTQPANPTPPAGSPAGSGPGAGLTSARPHLVDVITGNTAQPGIIGPIPIPRTTRPAGW